MKELAVLQEHASALLARANVIGVGIGYKVRRGRRLPTRCLTVLVSEKKPLSALSVDDLIPANLGGVPTDVWQSGRVRPFEQTERMRPAEPGLSIGHYRVTAGTFGAVVYDRETGEPLILSNNHVLANSGNERNRRASLGDPILQPGGFDGGTLANDQIGQLWRYIPLHFTAQQLGQASVADRRTNRRALTPAASPVANNRVDAAVAKPLQPDMLRPEIIGIGPVTGTTDGKLDLKVQKSGRTTGYSTGIILIQNVVLRVDYGSAGVCIFVDQLVSDIQSRPGDSGSLVLDLDGRAVGLLFAGGDEITVLNPIAAVAAELNITFLP